MKRHLPAWAATLVLALVPLCAAAQDYPTRPIRMIVPFAVGGLNDVLARLIAPRLGEALGQTVVVENKGGAGGNIGTEQVARAEPNGYTVLLSSAALAINPGLYSRLTYDVQRDFSPIMQISRTQMVVLASASLGVDSVRGLFERAKARPGSLSYGSSGTGSPSHLASESFVRSFGLDALHVPYKGAGPALIALSAGEVQFMVDVLPTALPLHRSGKMKILAVVADKRVPALPDVPTLAEAGYPGYDASSWNGILVPAGTPAAIRKKIGDALHTIMTSDDMRQRFTQLSVEPMAVRDDAFDTFIRSETRKWGDVIKAASIKAE